MGWVCDQDTPDGHPHEGYLVAVEPVTETNDRGYEIRTGAWRDVGANWNRERDGQPCLDVSHVQMACDCGWRSQRMLAPLGTTWSPCTVFLPTWHHGDLDDASYRLWAQHIGTLTAQSASLGQLAHVPADQAERPIVTAATP